MCDTRWSEASDEALLRAAAIRFAIYRLDAEAHMVWLAPDGRVVNHTLMRFPV